MRVTVSSPRFVTHSAASPYAIAAGRPPTLIVRIGPSWNVNGPKR
jgi:hypothetical protein